MNLTDLQIEVAAWQTRQPWEQNANDPLLGLIEEVGELSHAHLKMKQGIRGTKEEHQEAKEDAVGDILIYLADYCNKNQINMNQSMVFTWAKVSERNWTKFPKNGLTE
jgi:NTP pyrophosphatase (non-canonical NTP hydrolase)